MSPTPRDTLLQAVIDLTRLQRTRHGARRRRRSGGRPEISKTAPKPSSRRAQRE